MACCSIVHTGQMAIVQQCGEFNRTAGPGCLILVPCLQNVAATISTRVRQLDVDVDTKTKDNVFVRVVVSVQYRVREDKVKDAYYKLTDSAGQISTYVYDVIRSTVPRMELDQAFLSKEDVAQQVAEQLGEKMEEFGYTIVRALVIDLSPDSKVRSSMNEINANKRLRIAAGYRADAEKIMQVKAAEADAESKYLSGVGVAKQRKAIIDGLRESVMGFSGEIKTSPNEVMALLLMTQYFDTMGNIGQKNNSSTIFTPEQDKSDMSAQMRDGLLHAHAASMVR